MTTEVNPATSAVSNQVVQQQSELQPPLGRARDRDRRHLRSSTPSHRYPRHEGLAVVSPLYPS
jgi:hypothetical protein